MQLKTAFIFTHRLQTGASKGKAKNGTHEKNNYFNCAIIFNCNHAGLQFIENAKNNPEWKGE